MAAMRCSRFGVLSSLAAVLTLWAALSPGRDFVRSREDAAAGDEVFASGTRADAALGNAGATPLACPPPAPAAASVSTASSGADPLSLAKEYIRNSTAQCNRVYFDSLPGALLFRDGVCPDIESSIARTTRPPRKEGVDALDYTAPTIPDCEMRWYTPQEACDIIEQQGHLILIGDSLVRHLTNALFSILSNNYRYGALRNPNNDMGLWHECRCDGLYGGFPGCHGGIAMTADYWDIAEGAPQSSLMCSNWEANRIHFLGSYGNSFGGYPDDMVEKLLATSGTGKSTMYVINGIGYVPDKAAPVQDRIDTEAAFKFQWSKTLKHASTYNNTRLIFGTILAHHGFHTCQSSEALTWYNTWVRELAAKNSDLGIEIFDGRALMAHARSNDNVHMLSHDNVMAAQVLLNQLAKGPLHRRTRPAQYSRDPGGWRYRDGPTQIKFDQQSVDPETRWWLGAQFNLRGCRCFPDWQQRLEHNRTATVCHCRHWCGPAITPDYLTHNTGGCMKQGVRMSDPRATHMCTFTCRPDHGGANWLAEQCGPSGCPWPDPVDWCRDC